MSSFVAHVGSQTDAYYLYWNIESGAVKYICHRSVGIIKASMVSVVPLLHEDGFEDELEGWWIAVTFPFTVKPLLSEITLGWRYSNIVSNIVRNILGLWM